MKSNLMFDFSSDKKNNTIREKREFAADLSLVRDAYTKSEILDHWWAPKPWKARTKTMNFREGLLMDTEGVAFSHVRHRCICKVWHCFKSRKREAGL
jgi:uncharacterized protein YndB with AHSA1/START domain